MAFPLFVGVKFYFILQFYFILFSNFILFYFILFYFTILFYFIFVDVFPRFTVSLLTVAGYGSFAFCYILVWKA